MIDMNHSSPALRRNLLKIYKKPMDSKAQHHAGLLLDRYLADHDHAHPEKRTELMEHAIQACADMLGIPESTIYENKYIRWLSDLGQLQNPPDHPQITRTAWDHNAVAGLFRTKSRLAVGLGIDNVLETGIRLHHTYGVPVIPGSSIKGVTASFVKRFLMDARESNGSDTQLKGSKENDSTAIESDSDSFIDKNQYREIFGDSDQSGLIAFHDAWIVPWNRIPENMDSNLQNQSENKHELPLDPKWYGLVHDVMTPHHKDYYNNGSQYPTDFDDPSPIRYLSVHGDFLFSLSTEDTSDTGKAWLKWTFQVMSAALDVFGIGGKTTSGYGRLIPYDSALRVKSYDIIGSKKSDSPSASQETRKNPNSRSKKR